jgi:hypothetical protein
MYSASSCLQKKDNGIFSPVEIFHKMLMVGEDCPRSICPNMGLLTPVSSATSSSVSCLVFRISFSRSPIFNETCSTIPPLVCFIKQNIL